MVPEDLFLTPHPLIRSKMSLQKLLADFSLSLTGSNWVTSQILARSRARIESVWLSNCYSKKWAKEMGIP